MIRPGMESWGRGFTSADGWIEMIYRSLDGGP